MRQPPDSVLLTTLIDAPDDSLSIPTLESVASMALGRMYSQHVRECGPCREYDWVASEGRPLGTLTRCLRGMALLEVLGRVTRLEA